ncbi:hypothetical protein ACC719_15705 [Rhizobium ruizarguesonis]
MQSTKREQLEFPFEATVGGSANESGGVNVSGVTIGASATTAPLVEMPNFSSRSIYALTAKVAGRLNATAVSEKEHEAFLSERQKLLDRKFEGTITRPEENRLAYVRWSLDRIEDAKYGAALDVMEEQVERYESLLSELTKFSNQIDRAMKRR